MSAEHDKTQAVVPRGNIAVRRTERREPDPTQLASQGSVSEDVGGRRFLSIDEAAEDFASWGAHRTETDDALDALGDVDRSMPIYHATQVTFFRK